MDLNISSFFATVTPCELSGRVAEMGVRAGALTWAASITASVHHPMLDDEEKREAFRSWVRNSGFEDVEALSDIELNALLLQWIAGDLRQMGIDDDTSDIDWAEVETMQRAGTYPSNIFRGDDGSVYFDLSC